MWTPKALLLPVRQLQQDIDRTLLGALVALSPILAMGAVIDHIGSTAFPELLSSGTVDVLIRVAPSELLQVRRALEKAVELHAQPLPVVVHIESAQTPSPLLAMRTLLATQPMIRGQFLAVQEQYAHVPGRRYPEAKRRFFEDQQASAIDVIEVPPRIDFTTERLRLVSPLSINAAEYHAFRLNNKTFFNSFAPSDTEERDASFWEMDFAGEAIARITRNALTLLVRSKDDDALVGSIRFSGFLWGRYQHCYVGYNVAEAQQGKGYMTEAAAAALHYVHREWGVHRVQAIYNPANLKSAALLERLGFVVEGTLAAYMRDGDDWSDCCLAAWLLPAVQLPAKKS